VTVFTSHGHNRTACLAFVSTPCLHRSTVIKQLLRYWCNSGMRSLILASGMHVSHFAAQRLLCLPPAVTSVLSTKCIMTAKLSSLYNGDDAVFSLYVGSSFGFRGFRKTAKRGYQLRYVCPSFRLSVRPHGTVRLPLDRFS